MNLARISVVAAASFIAGSPGGALAADCPVDWAPMASQYEDGRACIDTRHIESRGDLRSVPWMIALDHPQTIDDTLYRSVIHQALVDCGRSKAAVSESRYFSGEAGGGAVVRTMAFAEADLRWDAPPSASALEPICAPRLSRRGRAR